MRIEQGFTLVELVIVVVLVSVIAGAVGQVLVYEIDTYRLISDRNRELQRARLALQFLTRDLRQILAPDSIFYADADSILFDDPNDTVITYTFNQQTLFRNGDALLPNVAEFDLSYYDETGQVLSRPVESPSLIRSIAFEAVTEGSGRSVRLRQHITPRNF